MLNKKLLAVAIVGTLAAGNAAAANLSAPGGAVPAVFAQEIVTTGSAPGTLLTTSASAQTQLNWNVGYNFSADEVRYARVECSNHLRFGANTGVTIGPSITPPLAAPGYSVGAINGVATNVVTFSVTSNNAGNLIRGTHVLTLSGDHRITSTASSVNCTVGLYDQPSQAQAGGSTGLIAGSAASGAYITFSPSYRLAANPTTHTASVEAVPTYSRFSTGSGAPTEAWLGWTDLIFGLVDPDGPQGTTLGVDGQPITLAALLAPTSTMELAGDFSIASNGTAPLFTGAALGRVRWYTNGTWTHNASTLTATKATFAIGNTATVGSSSIDLIKNISTPAMSDLPIPESEYNLTLKAVAAQPTVYAVNDLTVLLGRIVRDGTQLQAPLAQVPGDWISRLVLTNTSSIARPYTISVISETGNTVSTDNLTGTIPANGTYVIEDLNSVLTGFTTQYRRATLNVTVAGPSTAIQGLYQIVNPQKGSISNHVLVRPGRN